MLTLTCLPVSIVLLLFDGAPFKLLQGTHCQLGHVTHAAPATWGPFL